MNPQERQLVDELFDRLAKLEGQPRDPDAAAAIADGLRKAPNAIYPLVQTVLLQDEALKRANAHIQQLEAALHEAPQQQQSGGFLDSMRDALFGSSNQNQSHGSVPNVPPPQSRPVWNSGQVMPQGQPPGYGSYQQGGYPQGGYGQPYGGSAFGGGGSSFLGTAAAAAAGMVGGSLLMGGIRNLMGGGGGSHFGVADPTVVEVVDRPSPWSDQSRSDLARDAGINDIGGSRDYSDNSTRSGLFDQGSDRGYDNNDSDDFADNGADYGGDDGSQDI